MADKYPKIKPKVHPITISVIIGAVVLITALIIALQPSNSKRIYQSYHTSATRDFTEDHPFYEVNYKSSLFKKGLDKILDQNEVVLVYIGSPTCTSCVGHIGAFQRYYNSTNFNQYVDKIYYYSPGHSPKQFETFMSDHPLVLNQTPQLILFVDGEVAMQYQVGSTEDSQVLLRSVRDYYNSMKDFLDQ
ncbi:MAG: hypothetical protein WC225_05730 [Acholeplasmataceae bacterium]|nr:hypothetical protein [Acholeplasmataceae bacterium]